MTARLHHRIVPALALALSAVGVPAPSAAQGVWWINVARSLASPLPPAAPAMIEAVLPPGAWIPPDSAPLGALLDSAGDRPPRPGRAPSAVLRPYVEAAARLGLPSIATVTAPWVLETSLAIKALRRRDAIRSAAQCDTVVRDLGDALAARARVTAGNPLLANVVRSLHAMACADAETAYLRAQEVAQPPALGLPGLPPALVPDPPAPFGQVPYNAFPDRPYPVARCVIITAPTRPWWIFSDGRVGAASLAEPMGRAAVDYSRHYPLLVSLGAPAPVTYGIDSNGVLYARNAAGDVSRAGQCN